MLKDISFALSFMALAALPVQAQDFPIFLKCSPIGGTNLYDLGAHFTNVGGPVTIRITPQSFDIWNVPKAEWDSFCNGSYSACQNFAGDPTAYRIDMIWTHNSNGNQGRLYGQFTINRLTGEYSAHSGFSDYVSRYAGKGERTTDPTNVKPIF